MKHLLCVFLATIAFLPNKNASAQSCSSGTVYAIRDVSTSDRKDLYRIDTTNGTATFIANAFSCGPANTLAIALQNTTNTIWIASRGSSTTAPRIYSYQLPAGPCTDRASFSGLGNGTSNIKMAAFNPIDGNIYFLNSPTSGSSGTDPANLYRYTPGTTSATLVGAVTVQGHTDTRDFEGGDLAFDGLGNMTAVFKPNYGAGVATPDPFMAVFPGIYNASGAYTGLSLSGQTILDLIISPTGIGFLPSGDLIVGSSDNSGSFIRVNTNTGAQQTLSTNFASTDIASCAAPAPNIIVNKTAGIVCTSSGTTIQYTITARNTGAFHAINTSLTDNLPAGLTLQSASLNGQPLTGVTRAGLAAGILIKSINAVTDGQVFKGETATLVLTCTTTAAITSYSNQAFVKFNGWPQTTYPNGIPSDDPNTTTAGDATAIVTCASLSGVVYNDPNGQTNGVDGTVFANVTVTLYAADGTTVIATTTTNASGAYTFNVPPSAANYVVKPTPPTGYQHSSSTDASPLDGSTNVVFTGSSVTGVNFGIEAPPESYNVVKDVVGAPVNGVTVSLEDRPLEGSDPTDQAQQGSWSGKSLVITSLPTNGFELYYNGVLIDAAAIGTTGYVVPNYDPALLTIKAATVPGGTKTTSFNYATIDAAGVRDLSPATYTVNFSIGLPVVFDVIEAKITGTSLFVNWRTLSETNCSHYEVEASTDGVHFSKIGTVRSKAAGGNSTNAINYEFSKTMDATTILSISLVLLLVLVLFLNKRNKWFYTTMIAGVLGVFVISCNKDGEEVVTDQKTKIFVRIKQVDTDGAVNYSKVLQAINE